jgi:hypothetical protein
MCLASDTRHDQYCSIAQANWWKVGAKFAALVVAYDVAVLAVAYFAFFA